MNISLNWNNVFGTENAIVSKSDAHRALIAAALSSKKTVFNLTSLSLDIEATINCLSSLGAKFDKDEHSLSVTPYSIEEKSPTLNCNESGSTLRFLTPVAAVISNSPSFTGKGRLSQRPLTPLVFAMEKHGCSFSSDTIPFKVSGTLVPGAYVLPGDVSSQYISGLLFALPLLNEDSTITLSSPLQSAGYIDMTIAVLKKFNITVQRVENGFFIPKNQKYISPEKYLVEGDWSNIAPFMAAAALGGEITATGLNPKSKQSDIAILSVLEKFGANINYKNSNYYIKKGTAIPFMVDVSQFPDLFPTLAILACGAKGKSVLFNAKRLRLKESDRIESTLTLIKNLGGNAEADNDSLTIYGNGYLDGGKCDSFNDHRIVMAAAVASVISKNDVIISSSEAINKSFPDFIRHFENTGGKYNVI